MRGCRIPTAVLTREGFTHDRKFLLLKVSNELPLQHIGIQKNPEMCLFHTSIEDNKLTVSYRPPETDVATHELEIPLDPPSCKELERVDINMYGSPTRGFNMGERYNRWFSDRFGFDVILAYWGGNPRPVLGNIPGRPNEAPRPRSVVGEIFKHVPVIGSKFQEHDATIAFNDCAPYLVITEESAANVTSRLPDGVEMDITKFRANIILEGSPAPFDEDFWGALEFEDDTTVNLTANCGRCVSLNVDYETGKSGTGPAGGVLKLLTKDRRVDPGVKYSPVFGRYGFVSKNSEGSVLKIGEKVRVSQRNEARTTFCEYLDFQGCRYFTNQECLDWPGLST